MVILDFVLLHEQVLLLHPFVDLALRFALFVGMAGSSLFAAIAQSLVLTPFENDH